MTREELLQTLTNIGTSEDAGDRRNLLASVTDEVNALFTANENLTSANTKYDEDIKKLQEYNMQLFLRVGGQTKQKEEEPQKQTEELKYENLFNEKGELK